MPALTITRKFAFIALVLLAGALAASLALACHGNCTAKAAAMTTTSTTAHVSHAPCTSPAPCAHQHIS